MGRTTWATVILAFHLWRLARWVRHAVERKRKGEAPDWGELAGIAWKLAHDVSYFVHHC